MHVTIFGVYTAEYENWGEAVRGCELSDQPPPARLLTRVHALGAAFADHAAIHALHSWQGL